jgi:hypothetical protein
MIVLDKEFAFIDLAADVLKLSRTERGYMRKFAREFENDFSGKLWERIIARIANVECTDVAYKDFSDGTEAKTASTREYIDSKGDGRICGQISNCEGKTGWIRAACYNSYKGDIDYFLIPPHHNCTFDAGMIRFSYNRTKDTYSNGLEQYRVSSVYDVCRNVKNN